MKTLIALGTLFAVAVIGFIALTGLDAFAGDKFVANTSQVSDGGAWSEPYCPGPNQQLDVMCDTLTGDVSAWGYLTFNAPGTTTSRKISCQPYGVSWGGTTNAAYPIRDAGVAAYSIVTGPDNCVGFCGYNRDAGTTNIYPTCYLFKWQATSGSARVSP